MTRSWFPVRALAPAVALALAPLTAASQDKPAGAVGEAYTETLAGASVGFEMVPVPAGRSAARGVPGSPEVAVGPFWMGRIEIPWEVYDVYVFGLDEGGQIGTGKNEDAVSRPSKPYLLPGESFGHDGRPALAMTYHAAQEFAKWLSIKTGRKYRLPTEAEWEHACRAGQPEPGRKLEEFAWFADNSEDRTHAGGTRKPNAFGLADMLGNVTEWVTGADGEPVVKGGAYHSDDEEVSCAARRKEMPAWSLTDPQLPKSRWWLSDAPFVGFRLVREP